MLGRCSAATANDIYAVLSDEPLMIVGQFLRLQRIVRMSANVLRKPRVGQNRNIFSGIVSKVANGIVHLLGAGGTIHADYVYVEGLKRGKRGADLGAQ